MLLFWADRAHWFALARCYAGFSFQLGSSGLGIPAWDWGPTLFRGTFAAKISLHLLSCSISSAAAPPFLTNLLLYIFSYSIPIQLFFRWLFRLTALQFTYKSGLQFTYKSEGGESSFHLLSRHLRISWTSILLISVCLLVSEILTLEYTSILNHTSKGLLRTLPEHILPTDLKNKPTLKDIFL